MVIVPRLAGLLSLLGYRVMWQSGPQLCLPLTDSSPANRWMWNKYSTHLHICLRFPLGETIFLSLMFATSNERNPCCERRCFQWARTHCSVLIAEDIRTKPGEKVRLWITSLNSNRQCRRREITRNPCKKPSAVRFNNILILNISIELTFNPHTQLMEMTRLCVRSPYLFSLVIGFSRFDAKILLNFNNLF